MKIYRTLLGNVLNEETVIVYVFHASHCLQYLSFDETEQNVCYIFFII